VNNPHPSEVIVIKTPIRVVATGVEAAFRSRVKVHVVHIALARLLGHIKEAHAPIGKVRIEWQDYEHFKSFVGVAPTCRITSVSVDTTGRTRALLLAVDNFARAYDAQADVELWNILSFGMSCNVIANENGSYLNQK
jgi:hypothetical protein